MVSWNRLLAWFYHRWVPESWLKILRGCAQFTILYAKSSSRSSLACDFLKSTREGMDNHWAHILEWKWYKSTLAWVITPKDRLRQGLVNKEIIRGSSPRNRSAAQEQDTFPVPSRCFYSVTFSCCSHKAMYCGPVIIHLASLLWFDI